MTHGLRLDPPHATAAPNLDGGDSGVEALVQTGPGLNSSEINYFQENQTPIALIGSEHLEDLIVELQAWAARLDSREANLNAREALLDHRERSSRVAQACLRRDLEEQLAAVKLKQNLAAKAVRGEIFSKSL